MMPAAVTDPVAAHVAAIERAWPGRLAALYLVGGVALGDFSARQSNIDLVVVCDPPLDAEEQVSASRPGGQLHRAEQQLRRAGRPPGLWYAGWDEIADGPGRDPAARSPLETPLTRALLREEAIAYLGPDWPVVAFEEEAYKEWCRRSLEELLAAPHGMMVMRHDVSPLVLQAARLALGAATGRVASKSAAGDAAGTLAPPHFRRILNDAAGYRRGANTSMYWGPFERKYDARQLLRHLAAAVA